MSERPVFGGLLLLAFLLILHASLHPWKFEDAALRQNPLWLLWNSWPSELTRYVLRDAAVNVAGYIPLGLFAYLTRPNALWAMALALVLSTGVEILQLFAPTRYTSLIDVACNVAGAAVGVGLARMYGALLRRRLAAVPASPPLLVLLSWLGFLLFPLVPVLSRRRLLRELRMFWAAPFSWLEFCAGVVDWLLVAWLLRSAGFKSRRALLLLVLLAPARILLAGRGLTWPELLAAPLAFFLAPYMARATVLGPLALGAVIVRGLAPFELRETPGHFSWVPFAASLASERAAAAVVLFRKTFFYGAVVFLFGDITRRPVACALGFTALLAAIEAVQVHLAGRTAEITDPVLAFLIAITLRLLRRS